MSLCLFSSWVAAKRQIHPRLYLPRERGIGKDEKDRRISSIGGKEYNCGKGISRHYSDFAIFTRCVLAVQCLEYHCSTAKHSAHTSSAALCANAPCRLLAAVGITWPTLPYQPAPRPAGARADFFTLKAVTEKRTPRIGAPTTGPLSTTVRNAW